MESYALGTMTMTIITYITIHFILNLFTLTFAGNHFFTSAIKLIILNESKTGIVIRSIDYLQD